MSQDSRNYYDEQFNHRIDAIAKPGAMPSATSGSGSSGGSWGLKGVGGVVGIALFIAFRVMLATSHSSSNYTTPSYQYTPTYSVPPSKIDFQADENQLPDNKWGQKEDKNAEVDRLLKEILEKQKEEPRR